MPNKKQILETAGEFFKSGEIIDCYKCLLNAGSEVFIAKGLHNNYFNTSEFWSDFLADEKNFQLLFSARNADELVFHYFKKSGIKSTTVEEKLAKEFPLLFISGVRLTQAFLDKNRLSSLLTIELPESFHVHQKVWEWLYKNDQDQWNLIEIEWDRHKKDAASNHLINLIIWLEERYFENDTDDQLQQLSIVYNLFITLLLTSEDPKEFNLDEEVFYRNVEHCVFQRDNNPLESLLNGIYQWVLFNEGILVQYSYDLNVLPVWKNEQLFRFEYISQSLYKQWQRDGERYNANRFRYDWEANEIVDFLEENGALDLNKKSEYYWINKDVYTKIWKSKLFLDDLKLQNFVLYGKLINTSEILQTLLTYSTNRLHRYIRVLEEHSKNSNNWKEAFRKSVVESSSKEIDFEPYFLMSQQEYIDLNKNAIKEIPEEAIKNLIKLFGYIITPKNRFDRHSISYDVWNQPFLRIGKMLFCPMLFFAKNDWFYAFAQMGIRNLSNDHNVEERNRTSKMMERSLGDLFEKHGWSVKVITDQESNEMDGDIDVFVEDGQTQLLIQLKRTYFRTTLKDTFYETIKSDRKAAQQLNEGVSYLKTHSEIFKLKGEPIKWIVSTSFENTLTEINGCLKVNYFDLVWTLKNEDFSSIEEFNRKWQL